MGAGEDSGIHQESFERIEASVDAGQTDLRSLGFWRLLATVKADPALAGRWAEVAGRIDRKAFEARVRWRLPVWAGNALLLAGTAVGVAAIGLAVGTDSEAMAGLALLFAAGTWSTTWHDLAHWAVGRLVGIGFTWYFLGARFPPSPGLKIDYATYLRAPAAMRAWMHASGAIATKLASFVALAFWPATESPAWAAWGLVALGVLQIVTDVVFSVRSSDWKKVRRELRVAHRQAATGRAGPVG